MSEEMKRREWLKFTVVSVAAATAARAQSPHKFFSLDEYKMVDELTEILIPADDLSAGARAAKVVDYIDMEFGESFDEEPRESFRSGLKLVDQLSQKLNQVSFLEASAKQREAVVLGMAANERNPKAPEEKFFQELKGITVRGFYTSKVGIHDALQYKGNVYQPGDYAGELPTHPALTKISGTE